jgi:ubiquitin-like protein Nedd8
MEIIIKPTFGESFILEVDVYDTIGIVKQKIAKITSILSSEMRLMFAGKYMDDDRTIRNYNLNMHSTVYMSLIARGGG